MMLSATNPPSSGMVKGSALSNKVSAHKKTLTSTNIDPSAYLSHQQKQAMFEPSKALWQNGKATPGILTSSSNLPLHC